MKSILAINSNSCSISSIPSIMDNLIAELATSSPYNEINYHENSWYSIELEKQAGENIQDFLESSIFLELISAQILLIDATSACHLLSHRHLNYLDYLVEPNAFGGLSKRIEVIIFISSKSVKLIQEEIAFLIGNLSSHLFKEINVVDIYSDIYRQQGYPKLKDYILKQAA